MSDSAGEADYTEAELKALKAAYAKGVTKVRWSSGNVNQEVEYRSIASMERIIARMEASLGLVPIQHQPASYAVLRPAPRWRRG